MSRYPAALAVSAIALAVIAPAAVPGWSLILGALVGAVANAACVLAVFPLRVSQIVDPGRSASTSGFAALFAVGVVLVAQPAAWVCIAGSVAIALAIVWARLRRPRPAR